MTVSYQGQGKSESDGSTIKSNFPVSKDVGIYYFEVSIVRKGRDGYIGIGFSTSANSTNRLPGNDDHSWGYHAADGKKYNGNQGASYGPSFSTGDVIGGCFNFSDNSISFTRNGIMLGNAFKVKLDDGAKIYPCVGLRTPGEIVKANFGREPFSFDISQYLRDEKTKLLSIISETRLTDKPECSVLNRLVIDWLVKSGYEETAREFYESSIGQADILDETNQTFDSLPGSENITNRKCNSL